MSADEIADNFTLSKDETFCACDKCQKTFNMNYYGDIVDHYNMHKLKEIMKNE